MTVPIWSRARHAALAPARIRRAGSCACAAAVVASGETLAYTGEKLDMSAIGRIGMPGSVAPDPVQDAYAHASLDQAGNAVLGLAAALLALATVAPWGLAYRDGRSCPASPASSSPRRWRPRPTSPGGCRIPAHRPGVRSPRGHGTSSRSSHGSS